jgi:hypothetical protein
VVGSRGGSGGGRRPVAVGLEDADDGNGRRAVGREGADLRTPMLREARTEHVAIYSFGEYEFKSRIAKVRSSAYVSTYNKFAGPL